MQTASTKYCTLLSLHDKRGTMAMDKIGILPYFTVFSVNDIWASYYKYINCSHVLCKANILRNLKNPEKDWNCRWAGEKLDLLIKAKSLTEHDAHPKSLLQTKSNKDIMKFYPGF
jgi:transposase